CAAPSAKGDDKFITTDYLQQCQFFQASCVSRIYKCCSLVLPRSLEGFALSLDCGEHYWL
ncbi:hypothetical protein WI973_25425, partial [Salmonella enterica subsp. enterica serovar Corvallis]